MKVLMIGSDLRVKGGMSTVARAYLALGESRGVQYDFVPTHIDGNPVRKLFFFLKGFVKIMRVVGQYDLFHLHVSERGSFFRKAIIIQFLKRRKKKVLLHHHGPEFLEFYQKSKPAIKRYIRNVLASADVNISLSKDMEKNLRVINPSISVSILINGVPVPEKARYNNLDSSIVLFLGKIGDRKGAFDLFKAVVELDSEIDEKFKFYFCGNGEVDRLKQQVQLHRIGHRVPHVGWINEIDKDRILPNVVINVLPSYYEGLPMTILETMAYGIPNISTTVNAIPEVINNGYNGYLVAPGDVAELKSAIKGLLMDGDKRGEMSRHAFQSMRNGYDITVVMDKLVSIYQNVLKAN